MDFVRLFLVLALAAWFLYWLVSLILTHLFFSRTPVPPPSAYPPVSVLKPMRGLDFGLRENILSLLNQDYPAPFQIVFGFQNPQDPALSLAQEIAREFPRADVEIVLSGENGGVNEKVNNLVGLFKKAKHDYLVISDSDVRVAPDYLRSVIGPLARDPKVGLVTCLYRATHFTNLTSALEGLSINADFAQAVISAEFLEGIRFGLGATNAIRRKTLEDIGGLSALSDYAADDYQLGKKIYDLGYHLILQRHMIDLVMEPWSWKEFWSHQLRWVKTIRSCRPRGFFLSILTHGVFFAFLYALACGFSKLGLAVLVAVMGLRLAGVAWVNGIYLKSPETLRWLWLLPLRDILSAAFWFSSHFGDEVSWRSRRFRLASGGKLIPA